MTASLRRGDAARAARRDELLDAADRVITAAGPDASMRAIAAAAGITKPILYRYFGDKGGLYRALSERYLAPLVGAIRQALNGPVDARGRTRATVDAYLAFIESQPQAYRFLMQRASLEQREAQTAVAAAIHRLGDEVGAALREELRLDGAAADAATALGHGIVGMVHVAGDWWLEHRGMMSRGQLADTLTTVLLGGLDGVDPAALAAGARQVDAGAV